MTNPETKSPIVVTQFLEEKHPTEITFTSEWDGTFSVTNTEVYFQRDMWDDFQPSDLATLNEWLKSRVVVSLRAFNKNLDTLFQTAPLPEWYRD